MVIYAIDPGPSKSAVVTWDGVAIGAAQEMENQVLLQALRWTLPENPLPDREGGAAILSIEKVASYGMPVGAMVFETVWWSGRFAEAWFGTTGGIVARVEFSDVRLHLCRVRNAKESNVRRAILDRFGPPGTKKARGLTYGLKGHCWSAFALAVTTYDRRDEWTW